MTSISFILFLITPNGLVGLGRYMRPIGHCETFNASYYYSSRNFTDRHRG